MIRTPLFALLFALASPALTADDWPQWRGPRRDGVWREEGIVEKVPETLRFVWREEIGMGYAGPAVAEGRVYVTDRLLQTGEENPENPFDRRRLGGVERVICLDAASGNEIWRHTYPCPYEVSYPYGPRATPTVHDGRVYTVGAMGHLFAFDAAKGNVLWAKSYRDDFGAKINTWGAASSPLIEGDRLIVLAGGSDGACVVALDPRGGDELWRALDAEDPGYAPPVVYEVGGTRQLIVWTPDAVHSLDPATGSLHWKVPFEVENALSIAAPIFDPERRWLLVTSFYNGPLLLELDEDEPAASVVWKGESSSEIDTDKLHGLMCTPFFADGHIYGVGGYGHLRCLEGTSGKRIWETTRATGEDRWWNAFLIRHGDRYLISNEQGELLSARLGPAGYEETGRAFLIEPTRKVRRRMTVWSHPAFANGHVYARSDREIVCADLRASAYEK